MITRIWLWRLPEVWWLRPTCIIRNHQHRVIFLANFFIGKVRSGRPLSGEVLLQVGWEESVVLPQHTGLCSPGGTWTRVAADPPPQEPSAHSFQEQSEVKWKSLSRVRLFATPWTIQSMEFSRPEYWSGKAFPFSRGSSQPRDGTQVSRIAGRLPAEPQGKPKNPGVGRLSLHWQIFPYPGIEPASPALQADSLRAEPQGKPSKSKVQLIIYRVFWLKDSSLTRPVST